ncbi:hypothetical protein ZEAMMB73_Zm00001d052235 [Zea mays]|uniref:Uncharacterized protein n=1 Tax=Zea mays TaxID=4577 RepID=A0A1D6QEF9_MAIZE|nr:hypothetical protein ZEAMMB73_Zm00001d052235 [Zea mays]
MAGVDLGSGAAPVQAARVIATGTLEANWWRWRWRLDWRWRMPESEPARPPRRLLPCALAEFVEPEGVESDRRLNGGGCAAGNIGNAAAQKALELHWVHGDSIRCADPWQTGRVHAEVKYPAFPSIALGASQRAGWVGTAAKGL